MSEKWRRWFYPALVALLFGLLAPNFQPLELDLPVGATGTVPVPWPGLQVQAAGTDPLSFPERPSVERGWLTVHAASPGIHTYRLALFGMIPVGRLRVSARPALAVIPSGAAIGIRVRSQGTTVVGQNEVVTVSGVPRLPAAEAGVRVGDQILTVERQRVLRDEDLSHVVQEAGRLGKPLHMVILRGSGRLVCTVRPLYDAQDGCYRIGLYTRQTVTGIGTLTFLEPKTGRFGALGHMVMAHASQERLPIREGDILPAQITGIRPGVFGRPGEKVGFFDPLQGGMGRIERNLAVGIFGQIRGPWHGRAVPVATRDQVRVGNATLLTVIHGSRVEPFSIRIERIYRQNMQNGKGMIIRVVDPRLLRATGGIVQGMSGSPILQEGRLVGAVTHVFVNQADVGYAVFAESMAEAAGLYFAAGKGPAA